MTAPIQVLIASNKESLRSRVKETLTGPDFAVSGARSLEELQSYLRQEDVALILLHHQFGPERSLPALEEIQSWGWEIPVLCIVPSGKVDYEVKCLHTGAVGTVVDWGDYVQKLPQLIKSAVKNAQLQKDYQLAKEKIHSQALLLDYVQDAVVAWDTRGEITYSNYAARSLFTMEEGESAGKPVEEYYFSLFEPEVSIPTKKGTKEFRQERKFTAGDGSEIWVSSRISYIYDPEEKSKIIGFMDISRDITEQKRLNEQMEKAREKTAQAERLAELGELASGVAHQVNNPLTTIIAETQLAQNHLPPDHPAQVSIQAVEEAGWKAQKAVSHLLEFTRAPQISYRVLSVNTVIHRSLATIHREYPELKEIIKLRLAQKLPDVTGNPFQLEDLWVKLVLGKWSEFKEGLVGSIGIKTRSWKDLGVLVEIMDNGPSLSERELQHYFDPDYYQPQDSPASGLNLSICREIVRQHRGEIRIINQGEVGRNIQVFLPGGNETWNQPIF